MRNIFRGLIFVTALAANTLTGQVKQDPEAKRILDETSKKFKACTSIRADFTKEIYSSATQYKEKESGKVMIKGDKYYLEMEGLLVVCNGKTVWQIHTEDEEINKTTYDPSESPEFQPSKIIDKYKSGYRYIYIGAMKVGDELCYAIDLTPDLSPDEREKASVHKIRLFISKKDYTLRRWKIYEKNGNEYTYSINNVRLNENIPDAKFELDLEAYKEFEIIDLDD